MKTSIKRVIWIISLPVVAVILTGIYLFYKSESNNKKIDFPENASIETISAIPVDAVSVSLFKDHDLFRRAFINKSYFLSRISDNKSPFSEFIRTVVESSDSVRSPLVGSITLSLHYASKNDLSFLFVSKIEGADYEDIAAKIKRGERRERQFAGTKIFNYGDLSFAIKNNLLIASSSAILLESSLRHIAKGSSIKDNQEFSDILQKTQLGDNVTFFNHSQSGKLFSGIVGSKYLGHSDLFLKFSSWSVLKGDFSQNSFVFEGDFANYKGVANYSTVYNNLKPSELKIWDIIPFDTYFMLSVSTENFDLLFKKQKDYLELNKKLNLSEFEEGIAWVQSMKIREMALVYVPFAGKYEWVTILRKSEERGLFDHIKEFLGIGVEDEGVVKPFENRQKLSTVLGKAFSFNDEESVCKVGNYYYIGSKDILKYLIQKSARKFSLHDFISKTKASTMIGETGSVLTVILNASHQNDTLVNLFKANILPYVKAGLKEPNIELASFQILPTEEKIGSRTVLFLDKMEKIPEPDREGDAVPGWQLDTIVKIPTGPFELINEKTGEKEYLEQSKNMKLRLLDNEKKGVWTVPFYTPIRGYVAQIDYFRNNSRQMLFASGNELYLLERSGRFSSGFPKRVDSLILIGPKVFELGGASDYVIMLLHNDNTIRVYDRDCRPLRDFAPITTEETIKGFPEMLKLGNNIYWQLRTMRRVYFYNNKGELINTNNKKREIKPDSKIGKVSDKELSVTLTNGKEYVLNLENGEFKKKKK